MEQKSKKNYLDMMKTPRDDSATVEIQFTKPGCFMPTEPSNPAILREYEVGEKTTVSVGRAAGMVNKCKIISKPKKV